MLNPRILVVLSVGLFVAATASASPVLDGNINAGEYYAPATLPDVNEDIIVQDDLDIKSVGFDICDGYFWMGVEVYAGPMETDGGDETNWGQTIFYANFVTGSDTERLRIVLENDAILSVTLNNVVLTDGVQYEAALGSGVTNGGLEIKILDSLLSPTNFDFVGQLDDTGFANDDDIVGFADVPEPVTLTLIAIGLPLALIRRRRR